jgi:hypothetical protein
LIGISSIIVLSVLRHVDEGRLAGDVHRLRGATDLELELEGHDAGAGERDVAPLRRLESRELRLDGVGARRQGVDPERALRGTRRAPDSPGVLIRGGDRHARQRGISLIVNRAGDRRRGQLRM